MLKCDFRKVDATPSHKCFADKCLDIVSTAFVLKPQKNLHG